MFKYLVGLFLSVFALFVQAKILDGKASIPSYKINVGVDIPLQVGVQGQYYLLDSYYVKTNIGFVTETMMTFQNKLDLFHSTEDKDLYKRDIIDMMSDSVLWDARLGWSSNLYDGLFLELAWRVMAWGATRSLSANKLKKYFKHSLTEITSQSEAVSASNKHFAELLLSHGPALHIGYSTILVSPFFLNIEFNVYKPIFSQVRISSEAIQKSAKTMYHALRENVWLMSAGLWISFLF